MSSFALTMAATLFTEAVSLWTLLAIRRDLLPLIARDRARDPAGTRRRYRAYDLSYGPTAIVISGIAYVLSMAPFHLGLHSISSETAVTIATLLQGSA